MAKYVWLPLILALLVTGCSSEESSVIQDDGNVVGSTDQVNEDSPVEGKIGYSAMSLKNPFFGIISDSLKKAGAAHGFEVTTTDADSDVKKQANQIEDFISQGVDAIVLNPTDRLAIGPAIKKANEAGIPVFTCDLQCVAEGVEIAGHIGTGDQQDLRLGRIERHIVGHEAAVVARGADEHHHGLASLERRAQLDEALLQGERGRRARQLAARATREARAD